MTPEEVGGPYLFDFRKSNMVECKMANKDKVTSPKVARNASSLLREEVSLKAPKWTFEEYVLALNLYLESDRGAVGKTSPKVQILSQQM